jgi:hypothetical protein
MSAIDRAGPAADEGSFGKTVQLVDGLERADVAWCAAGGVALNHWAVEPMVTQDVDFVVASAAMEHTAKLLEEAGFKAERKSQGAEGYGAKAYQKIQGVGWYGAVG